MVEPLGIEPSYHALQARAMTTLAQVPLTDEDLKEVCFYSFPPIYILLLVGEVGFAPTIY